MTASARASGKYPCVGDTYLSWGKDGDPDAPFVTRVECDGGPLGDCRWQHVIEVGDWSGGVSMAEMQEYERQHLAHRARARDEVESRSATSR